VTVLRWGSATDVGLVRAVNQDSVFTSDTLFAVADGMGGHVAGEVASEVAIRALREAFERGDGPRRGEDLVTAVRDANQAVFTRSTDDGALRGMGTTMTAAALVNEDGEERLAVANVGDSRTYVFTQSELTQLTEDHSVPEELVRQGQLDPADVETHPQRHILTRAVGIQPDIDVDLWEILPLAGDRLLLCSDGLVREVTDDQIASVLRRLADPKEAATELIARARAGGGSDNISVVIVDVVDDGDRARQAAKAAATQPQPVIKARETIRPASTAPPTRWPDADPPSASPSEVTSEPAEAEAPKLPKPKRRWFTFRSVLFVILVIAILGGAAAAVEVYARGSYYVTVGPTDAASQAGALGVVGARPILVYKGRPGGVLWFDPTLAERTRFTSAQVCPARLQDLTTGKLASSLSAADRYINNLLQEAESECGRPASTSSPSTSTPARSSTSSTSTT
jgi:protein phosphatase